MISKLLLLLVLNSVLSQEVDKENEVYVLNSDNFDEVVGHSRPLMVNFYAPWCQYSQKLKPHFDRVAQDFAAQNKEVSLGKVDIVEEADLAKRFNIKRYPTLILFKGGRQILYNKTNNYVTISNWLDSKTVGLVLRVVSVDDYQQMKKKHDLLLAIDEEKHSSDVDLAAENIDDVQFIVVDTRVFPVIFPDHKSASMVVIRNADSQVIPFQGAITIESITAFVLLNDLPPVVTYAASNGPKIFSNIYKPRHFLLFVSGNPEAMTPQMEIAAVNHKEVRFAIVDIQDNATANIVTFFKVDTSSLPSMILSDTGNKKLFVPEFKEVDGRRIDQFISDVDSGKVEQFLKSQPVPDHWDSEPLKVLVGRNFEQVAYDRSKHVFVEFYAPWCSHCKQLAPVWERLAKTLNHVPDLVIAKLDKTENDIKDIEITSFPTLKLFLKDTNEIVSYTGLRTKEAFVEFLSKYTNISLDADKQEL